MVQHLDIFYSVFSIWSQMSSKAVKLKSQLSHKTSRWHFSMYGQYKHRWLYLIRVILTVTFLMDGFFTRNLSITVFHSKIRVSSPVLLQIPLNPFNLKFCLMKRNKNISIGEHFNFDVIHTRPMSISHAFQNTRN